MESMDLDLDQELMQKFSCMGTTDKDILISEFQRLLGFQLNPAGCAFFLDMTNWNLQAAIGAYYDFESPNISAPCMSFVKDVTIGEGESVPPDTTFTKTWRIQNTGVESWPPGVCLKYVGGDQFGHINMVMVRSLDPQEMADVSVQMHSPVSPGMYQGQWRMCTATGLYYGDVIWVILSVEVGGLLEKSKCPNSSNNNSPQDDSGHQVAGEHWQGSTKQLQQDQNGLSHNSVDIVANSLQSNLSVVSYNQGIQEPYPFGHS
ncbi:hypothetical protein Q5P01_007956 [Channa striata]|uniref:Protein ILRUN n=1 Tax=Channa striata TaxID=64152 RepID=A0AA88SVA8_CHASR|nr:hypothetical protein Q5P01_007956 [Channa striata]